MQNILKNDYFVEKAHVRKLIYKLLIIFVSLHVNYAISKIFEINKIEKKNCEIEIYRSSFVAKLNLFFM